MGLTLNSNSLALASAGAGASSAAGLSTADVTTSIKSNTPYQFIAKINAVGSTVSAPNVFSASDGFSTYRIIMDSVLTGNTNSNQLAMRFAVGGAIISTSVYGWAVSRPVQYNQETTDSRWKLIPSNDISGGYNSFIDFTNTASGLRAQASWHCSGAGSGKRGIFCTGSGSTDNTDEVTGFEIFAAVAFTAGTIRIYGVNNA